MYSIIHTHRLHIDTSYRMCFSEYNYTAILLIRRIGDSCIMIHLCFYFSLFNHLRIYIYTYVYLYT